MANAMITLAKRPEAVFSRLGQGFQVESVNPQVLRALCSAAHVPNDDPAHGYQVEQHLQPLFLSKTVHGKQVLCFNAGLEVLVRQILAQAGYEVVIADLRDDLGDKPIPWPLPVPLASWHGPVDQPLLDLVGREERALIRYEPSCVSPGLLIAQLALAWPSKKIHVAVSRIEEARQLRDQLRPYLPETTVISSRNTPGQAGQVVAGTYVGLMGSYQAESGTELEWVDILIALDGRELMSARGWNA